MSGITDLQTTIRLNEILEPLPKGGRYLGFLFAEGKDQYMVKKALKKRDLIDTKRNISPLRLPLSAYIVDTSKLSKKQMLDKLSRVIDKKLFDKYGRNY